MCRLRCRRRCWLYRDYPRRLRSRLRCRLRRRPRRRLCRRRCWKHRRRQWRQQRQESTLWHWSWGWGRQCSIMWRSRRLRKGLHRCALRHACRAKILPVFWRQWKKRACGANILPVFLRQKRRRTSEDNVSASVAPIECDRESETGPPRVLEGDRASHLQGRQLSCRSRVVVVCAYHGRAELQGVVTNDTEAGVLIDEVRRHVSRELKAKLGRAALVHVVDCESKHVELHGRVGTRDEEFGFEGDVRAMIEVDDAQAWRLLVVPV
mmetsp:Transcript_41033/g.112959  ORF Transcript_41033/g.112959 Transcript_41033/m.112959 type:complete len:265 (-) Transcript_41033:575-1369(-)